MKISRDWLQTFFDDPLPEANELAHALTFHAFEIDGVINDVLDVKVTPNRGHDCLSYRGIAKEVSAILELPLKNDPLLEAVTLAPLTDKVSVSIQNPDLCARYTAALIRGVTVKPSPEWLVRRLAAMGQHSINNVVDATNYVMFNLGQPLHAFDARNISQKDGAYAISVRTATDGEKILALDDKEYALTSSMLVICDENVGAPIGIAGVKGGKPAGIFDTTTDIILESANFSGVSVRKTAQSLKLRTDASARFEQVISPELAAYGMKAVVDLIHELAGGELVGYVDAYSQKSEFRTVSVSKEKINTMLGIDLSESVIEDAFARLGFSFQKEGSVYEVTSPFERLDLVIAEDLVEEVGRIVGYDKVAAVELPSMPVSGVNPNFYASEKARTEFVAKGYSEVITSAFSEKGERLVSNKIDGVKPYLRATLKDGLTEAYERNVRNKDLLGLSDVCLFEIGAVWSKKGEVIMLGTVDKKGVTEGPLAPLAADAYDALPTSSTDHYESFSKYPFIVRDVAMWVPFDAAQGKPAASAGEVLALMREHAGSLLVRSSKFDEFAKGDRISYAFRLVFQSPDRTLFDGDANERMESIYTVVKVKGWEVR